MNEQQAPCEVSDEPCSVVLWCLVMTEGKAPKGGALLGIYTDLPVPRDTQRPCKERGQKWMKHVDQTLLSLVTFSWSL